MRAGPVTTAARNRPVDFHGRPVFEEVSGKRTPGQELLLGIWGRCAVYGGEVKAEVRGRRGLASGVSVSFFTFGVRDSWDSTGDGAKGQPGDAT